jgi:hypothetical protein
MNRIEELFSLYDKEDINKMSASKEAIGVCSICGLNDHWNSKDNNGKWFCYRHCSEEKAEQPKELKQEVSKEKVEDNNICYFCGVYDIYSLKNKDNKYICYKCQLWVDFNQDKDK